ncbi:HPF/RaiA family ribosome-associated protein [Halomonas cerina]|uniref:Cold shock CspA family protein/ribosome-associated translation inhibitor RaiA n=1 Tax=Halomonas cerina TaxID=447424 RepID=A0A839V5U4_9GAMM|nr:HPF/RaiA family ribosome-associated protein [Halomonas cerina]MBB3188939.1 cold shock CspA family protein/ribosome-associated translation inhibitor RaiA [Halomonas cerina]
MQVPLNISYHHLDGSEWIDDYIKSRVAKLEQISDDIVSCRVLVERSQHPHQTGNPHRVLIQLSLPARGELVAEKTDKVNDPHVQLRRIIRDAFEAMEKQLKKATGKRGAKVVHHNAESVPPEATVVRIFDEEGYGFLKDFSGEEIYFHRNAVLHNDFPRLTVGTRVRYEPEEGEEGWQASSVQIIDKPGVGGRELDDDDLGTPAGWQRD